MVKSYGKIYYPLIFFGGAPYSQRPSLLLELLLVGEAYGATHIHGLFGLVNNFGIIGSEGLPASGFLGFCLTEAHVVNHGIIALSHDHLVNLDIGAELLAELRNQILFGKPGVAEVADGGIGERVGNGRNHIALVAGSVPAEFVAVGAEVGFEAFAVLVGSVPHVFI